MSSIVYDDTGHDSARSIGAVGLGIESGADAKGGIIFRCPWWDFALAEAGEVKCVGDEGDDKDKWFGGKHGGDVYVQDCGCSKNFGDGSIPGCSGRSCLSMNDD